VVQSSACTCIDRQLEPVVIITCSNPTGNVPIRHHGVHIDVMKDSESANVTVRLEVNTVGFNSLATAHSQVCIETVGK